MYTGATGWNFTDVNPWGSRYNYDDPRFISTISWWRSLIEKGYMPPIEASSRRGGVQLTDVFAAGRSAMNTNGSWMTNSYMSLEGVDVGIAPNPIGPAAARASMYNGLADSIWAGTRNPEAAWKWVKFLGSADCQNIVAEHAVVFPAVEESLDIAVDAFEANGIDITPFTLHVENGTTFGFPVNEHAVRVDDLMRATMDDVMAFNSDPQSALPAVNDRINGLFDN